MAAPKGNKNHLKHGKRYTRLYSVWRSMRQRCYNPKVKNYFRYGGRGITVCKEWDDFQTFYEWAIANGYDENAKRGECTIDRIDNNKNYEPSNCRFISNFRQTNNMRSNRIICFNGESMTMADFCREYNLKYKVFSSYLCKGFEISVAMEKGKK